MPNISSSELIAQFQTALRDGWGTSTARRAKSGRRHSRTPRAVNRQRNMVKSGSDTAWRTAPAFLRGRFGSSAGTATTVATPCFAVTAAHPAVCPPENEPMARRSNPALPSTNSTPRRVITTSDCISARARLSKPKARRMALSRRKSAAGGRIGAS